MNHLCVLIASELGISWDRVQSAGYAELMQWAGGVMSKWIREGGDPERLEKYFEELVDGADYSSLWDALKRAEKR